MSAPAFTPGPWEAHTFSLTTADRKHTLAHFGPISGKMRADSTRESEANCRLSGAAPELYEATRLWAEYDALLRKYTGPQSILFDGDAPEVDAAYDRARDATFAALAKARGEQ